MSAPPALRLGLLVVLPLLAVAALGLRLVRDEASLIGHAFDEALLGRLAEIDRALATWLSARERDLLVLTQTVVLDPAGLRRLARRAPLIGQVFVLDRRRRFIHPRPDTALTRSERELLERAAAVRIEQDLGPLPTDAAGGARSGGARRDHGWTVWYWGRGVNLVFWRLWPGGMCAGVEVETTRLLAEIVAQLPATGAVGGAGGADERLALVDAKGRVVYQWGGYEPASVERPRVRRPLSHPLSTWAIEHHVPGSRVPGPGWGAAVGLAAGVGALALALGALALALHREYARSLEEAMQRVTFVNQVSHELRTPLTNICMYAELLERKLDEEDAGARRHLDVIVAESQRLGRLIRNVLSFARHQRQALVLQPGPGIVDEVVTTTVAQFRPALEARGIEVRMTLGAPRRVRIDADAVGQVLGNLIANVEKYAASGRSLDVTTGQEGDRATIVVADAGPGIPRLEGERVFEPFYRLSDRVADGVTGTGIGLTIARELARRHGGDLVVEPAAVGARLRLTIDAPIIEDGPV